MATDLGRRGRLLLPLLGGALFLAVFASVFLVTLSGDAVLSRVRSALARRGYGLVAGDAHLRFPLSIRIDGAVLSTPSGETVPLDTAIAGWDFSGLFRGLPGHVRLAREAGAVELLTSWRLWAPGKGRARIANVSSRDLAPLLPAAGGTGFFITAATIGWSRSSRGALAGGGTAELASLRFPVPAKDSPVREAVLDNVRMRFTIREGDLQVSTLTARYEGSDVDGTGVISRIADPSAAAITFHLRIRNPLEGKIAVLFDLMAKNAKNANLRVTGPLLSPSGEFQFF